MGERIRARLGWTAVTLAILAVLGGGLYAVTRSDPPEGDCSFRLRFDGRTYATGGFGDQQRQPRTGPVIGRAQTLDCDGEPLGRVRVRAAVGVPSEQAIVWQRAVQLSTSDSIITEPVTCTGPARFTGRFRYTDHDNPDQTELPPPYDAWFEARRGSGLPLDDMRWVLVRARVTAGTRPELDAGFIDEVRGSEQLVRVVAHCVGGRFVADRVVRHPTAPGPS